MPTDTPIAVKQRVVRNLDIAAGILLEGTADLTTADMNTHLAPACTPAEALRLAIAAVRSAAPLLGATGPAEDVWQHAEPDLRADLSATVRRLLGGLTELPAAAFQGPLAVPAHLEVSGPPVATLSDAVWGVTSYLAILAGDVSVTRSALGRPEMEWQREPCL